MDFQNYFKDKKVTVMGLGLLGRGVGDAACIAESGAAEVIVTDLKTEEELKESVEQLKDFNNVKFVLGEHRNEDFENRDFILVAAGVPMNSPYLDIARKANVPLKQSAALFAELSKVPVIGITGTRGKSTVTHMIHHTLSVTTGEDILLGGNVRGLSNLQLLKDVKEDSLCVMELDSWQLQGWGWSNMSPQISVFTNFMEDHLNYYQKDGVSKEEGMSVYFKDKAQIFLHQEESGVFITTPEVFSMAQNLSGSLGQEVVLADSSIIPEDCLLAMPGEHNRLNAALAYEALKAISLTDEEIFSALASFPGVEGRLQFVKNVDNVRIYNDNNATTPQAVVAALGALDVGNKNIVLICGGADKGNELGELVKSIEAHAKRVIAISGTGTDKLLEVYPDLIAVENLDQAVEEARITSDNGDIILFSPGFASFGTYKNEYERNDHFTDLISSLNNQ